MSNVIDFLERLGQDSSLRYASSAVLEGAAREGQMTPQLWAALKACDRSVIESVLGANSNVCCMTHAPIEGEDEKMPPKTKEAEVPAESVVLRRIA
jgi:hypothetical protein